MSGPSDVLSFPAGSGGPRPRGGGRMDEAPDLLTYKDDDESAWLLPYVDVASLLLATMILILAMSKVNLHRFELLSSTLNQEAPPPSLEALKDKLDVMLRQESLTTAVSTQIDDEGLRILLRNALLFESGQSDITVDGKRAIDRVLAFLPSLDRRYQIAIEGHTDDVPIHTARFGSNWDLSTMRAVNVLEAFLTSGVDPRRLSAQGYADTRPTHELTSEVQADATRLLHARGENRRVVIRVY